MKVSVLLSLEVCESISAAEVQNYFDDEKNVQKSAVADKNNLTLKKEQL